MITIAVKYITVHYFTKCFLQDVNSVLACFHEYIQSAFRLKCKLQVTVTLDTGYILNLFTSSFTSVNLSQLNPLCYSAPVQCTGAFALLKKYFRGRVAIRLQPLMRNSKDNFEIQLDI